jgi:hypothetical protein
MPASSKSRIAIGRSHSRSHRSSSGRRSNRPAYRPTTDRTMGARRLSTGSKFDFIIIGAGIAGCTMFVKLQTTFPSAKIKMLEKNEACGGIWASTKWSWLHSDTPAIWFCPHNYVSKMDSKKLLRGVEKEEILSILEGYVKDADIDYKTNVLNVKYDSTSEVWTVNIDSHTSYRTKCIINATGLFQIPAVPRDMSRYLKNHNVKYVHSSMFDTTMITRTSRIAIVGSRESGVQIAMELAKQEVQVYWFARSFNNLYIDTLVIDKFMEKLMVSDDFTNRNLVITGHYSRIIGHYSLTLMRKLSEIVELAQLRFNVNITPLFSETDLFGIDTTYDPKKPLKPVFINYENNKSKCYINPVVLKSYKQLVDFDMVVLATGYEHQSPFDIYVDDELKDVDVFYLLNYTIPRSIPNMFFLLPYSLSSWRTAELLCEIIIDRIQNNCKICEEKHDEFKRKVDDYISSSGMNVEEYKYHHAIPTLDPATNLLITLNDLT